MTSHWTINPPSPMLPSATVQILVSNMFCFPLKSWKTENGGTWQKRQKGGPLLAHPQDAGKYCQNGGNSMDAGWQRRTSQNLQPVLMLISLIHANPGLITPPRRSRRFSEFENALCLALFLPSIKERAGRVLLVGGSRGL